MSILPSPSSTRLVTIVAHVDHGKTTLADSLIEHNGIISERLAGSMRFLDSLEEEQRRGITIRSSAIALKHTYRPMKIKANPNNAKKNSDHKNADNHGNGNVSTITNTSTSTSTDEKKNKEMVIHLIDSPGHVDFSMEVSSALQICDGALLIVDVVEGMCARTQSILREAYAQKLVPILVLNKMDRLCTDLGLNVNEAYLRIRSVVESVNAAASAMIRSDKAKEGTGTGTAADDATGVTTANNRAGNDAGKSTISATTSTSTPTKNGGKETNKNDEEEDEEVNIWTFEPSKGNVVFASAIYGWGFTIPSLARSLFKSKTIKVKPPIMRQYLFGDFKYDSESGKLLKWKQQAADDDSASTTMFAEYGLKPLWSFVEGVSTAATSLGKESIFFSANNYSTYTTNTNTNDHHDYNEEKSSKKQNNAKIEATTPGMNDSIFPSLQIGATVPDDVQKSLQTPKTLDEMQQILNKTTASSEELILRALLRRHRPLSGAVLDAVCDVCPSPSEASSSVRQEALSLVDYNHGPHQEEFDNIQNAVKVCNADPDSPTFAHCSKFISTSRAHINDNELFSYLDSIRNKEQESEEEQNKKESVIILGVGRVLSGVLRSKDIEYYCYGPKYDPNRETEMLPKKSIRLYILMGSSYVRVNSIPAGHICAIHGLEELQLKTVSLCSSPHAMPLGVTGRGIRPLVKVNVEAKSASGT
jgi:ribosome assembly protein 1